MDPVGKEASAKVTDTLEDKKHIWPFDYLMIIFMDTINVFKNSVEMLARPPCLIHIVVQSNTHPNMTIGYNYLLIISTTVHPCPMHTDK